LDFERENSNDTMLQSFCSSLQREMNDYYKLIAVLEAQISKSEGRDPSFLSDDLDTSLSTNSLTLKRLVVWMRDSLQRLRLMSVLIDACQGNEKALSIRCVVCGKPMTFVTN
jgi:gamma-tubulin complex component 3